MIKYKLQIVTTGYGVNKEKATRDAISRMNTFDARYDVEMIGAVLFSQPPAFEFFERPIKSEGKRACWLKDNYRRLQEVKAQITATVEKKGHMVNARKWKDQKDTYQASWTRCELCKGLIVAMTEPEDYNDYSGAKSCPKYKSDRQNVYLTILDTLPVGAKGTDDD